MKSDVLKLFRAAIGAVDPYLCVKHHLVFNAHRTNDEKKELHIEDNDVILDHNLYIAAFGKAALGMCRAVNELYHEHIIKGIASIPVGTIEQAKRKDVHLYKDGIYPSWNCSFDVYEGAQNNLPDHAAMTTAQRIQTMISKTMKADDILLVLISGKVTYTKEKHSSR
ncbi:hypothetical protein I4U23_009755 [Adineta vaga]|nr:hypothetical protein I4U23_009755 [Adineta vaga]